MNIPFSPPYIDEDVINEVVDTLRSGWITTGPKVKALEAEIEKLTGSESVLCVNSWTSGALLILKWLGIKSGDEVIIPAYTYSATAFAVIHAGATPVMVDVGEDFNISIEAIKNAITPRTKAIIPVDIAGFPCDYEKITELVESLKSLYIPENEVQKKLGRILILSDAAHSLGATIEGGKTGSNVDVVVFSLHAVKNITTAEGGAICLNLQEPFDNKELYSILRVMSLNCQTKDAFTKTQAGAWRYDIIGDGLKINMADVNAAIGLAQIRKYNDLLVGRKRVAMRYKNAFDNCEWAIMPPLQVGNKESCYHIFPLRIKDISEEKRDAIIQKIADKGIAVNVHFVPMPMFTYFSGLGFKIEDYPVAYNNYKGEISLPIYPQLTDEQVDYIIQAVKDAYLSITK